jgi:hypothetical protein
MELELEEQAELIDKLKLEVTILEETIHSIKADSGSIDKLESDIAVSYELL